MELLFTSQMVLFLIIGVVIGIIFIIILSRWWLGRYSDKALTGAIPTVDYYRSKKYPWVDVMTYNTTTLLLGLLISVGMVVIVMNMTQYKQKVNIETFSLVIDEEIEIEPPRTAEPPPPPPPPPPPIIAEVPNEEILEEDQPIFEDQTVEEETVFKEIIAPPPPEEDIAPPPPPPPPPPEEQDVQEIFKVVEQMPLFGGCSDKVCSDEALIKYIQGNIEYPAIARENGFEGRVYIQFVVETNGKVNNVVILRDIGAGCGEAALNVIRKMNDLAQGWTPGKQRGKAVRVLYTLPATFRLEG